MAHAIDQTRGNSEWASGREMAITGLITGILGIIVFLLAMLGLVMTVNHQA